MDVAVINEFLDGFRGTTFASLDYTDQVNRLFRVEVSGRSIVVFNGDNSGYETMLNRALRAKGIGFNYEVGDLPWGERIRGPLIGHRDRFYLQHVVLKPGAKRYFLRDRPATPGEIAAFTKNRTGPKDLVDFRCLALDKIQKIQGLGRVFS